MKSYIMNLEMLHTLLQEPIRIQLRKFLWENLAGNSCGKILQENLVGKFCGKILWEILWEILAGKACGKS